MVRFNLDFAWDSAINISASRAAYARSISVALATSGPRNERSNGNSPNTSAEGTTLSGPSVPLHALIT